MKHGTTYSRWRLSRLSLCAYDLPALIETTEKCRRRKKRKALSSKGSPRRRQVTQRQSDIHAISPPRIAISRLISSRLYTILKRPFISRFGS